MRQLIDLTGQRFGRLLVLERSVRQSGGNSAWVCRCDCGAVKVIRGAHMRSGRSASCGCLMRDLKIKPDDQITYNSAHYRIKRARGYPSAHACGCGRTAEDWALRHDAPVTHVGDDGHGNRVLFSGDPYDYVPLCKVCHRHYDSISS